MVEVSLHLKHFLSCACFNTLTASELINPTVHFSSLIQSYDSWIRLLLTIVLSVLSMIGINGK